jgi:uncharacterized protein (TIGR03083 family)
MNAGDILRYGQGTLLAAVDTISPDDLAVAGACGDWSVKDIVAHLASYERLLEDILGSLFGETTVPYLDRFRGGAAFNDAEVDARRLLPPGDVLDELSSAHGRTLALLERIPDDRRREPGTLPWYGAEYSLDDVIVYMYYGHKREHSAQIDAFRDRQKGMPR